MPKSTRAPALHLLATLFLLPLALAQSDCIAKAFPAILPMAPNETLAIDLHHYFQGSNLTFSVTPSNENSTIDSRFGCQEKASVAVGGVVASHMASAFGVEIQAVRQH